MAACEALGRCFGPHDVLIDDVGQVSTQARRLAAAYSPACSSALRSRSCTALWLCIPVYMQGLGVATACISTEPHKVQQARMKSSCAAFRSGHIASRPCLYKKLRLVLHMPLGHQLTHNQTSLIFRPVTFTYLFAQLRPSAPYASPCPAVHARSHLQSLFRHYV